MLVNLRLFFGVLWQPLTAVRSLRDRAPVAFAVAAAWLMATFYGMIGAIMRDYVQAGRGAIAGPEALLIQGQGISSQLIWVGYFYRAATSAIMIVLFVAVVYVPFAILVANLFEKRAGYMMVMRDEYAAVTACALISMAAALLATSLPAIFIGWQSARLPSDAVMGYFVLLILMPLPIFAALMTITLGTIFRVGWAAAAVTALVSFLTLIALPLLINAATFLCASPLLLLLLLFLLRDRVDDFMRSHRARASFKQNLEASTLNPADASAHYNLGLLYQQRGDFDSAAAAYKRAIEIDPREVDSLYQLGIIHREQGRYSEAIQNFEKVLHLEPTHTQHEIWRETALVYYLAGQYPDALQMLERFLDHRPSDAQARYWRGMTLNRLGRIGEAISEMQSCIEMVKTAPAYKYRTERQWLHQAESFLRERQ